jgi:hypothetical protein
VVTVTAFLILVTIAGMVSTRIRSYERPAAKASWRSFWPMSKVYTASWNSWSVMPEPSPRGRSSAVRAFKCRNWRTCVARSNVSAAPAAVAPAAAKLAPCRKLTPDESR